MSTPSFQPSRPPPLESHAIPPKILGLAEIPEGSPLFRALAKRTLYSWPTSIHGSVIGELNELLAMCVSMGHTAESCHIDLATMNVKNELKERLAVSRMPLREIECFIAQKAQTLRRRPELFPSFSDAR
jgi:hypothetical protein